MAANNITSISSPDHTFHTSHMRAMWVRFFVWLCASCLVATVAKSGGWGRSRQTAS